MHAAPSVPIRICGFMAGGVLALLVAGGSVAAPRSADALAPTLRAEMRQLVAAGVPGVVVLVRRDNGTLSLASGSSRLTPKTPMRPANRFRIGSITKSFVATVVLQLAGEGKLSLDDTVERWVPGLVPNGGSITLRHLLSHRSGLYDYLNDPKVLQPYLDGNFGYEWKPRSLVAVSTAHQPLFLPGARYAYSNTNYILLGLTVEAATGSPIGDELSRRIFEPLALRSTSFDTKPQVAGPFAHGYLVQGKRPLQDVSLVSPSYAWAAGAIVSTADDIARFYQALLGGRLLQPDLLQAMETTQDDYGLGLARTVVPPSLGACGTFFGHDGAIAGYNSLALSSPDASRQTVVLVNSLTLDDKVGNKQAEGAMVRLVKTAVCGS
jgi:D-alanyl-D-alanine carboxypeptidase